MKYDNSGKQCVPTHRAFISKILTNQTAMTSAICNLVYRTEKANPLAGGMAAFLAVVLGESYFISHGVKYEYRKNGYVGG